MSKPSEKAMRTHFADEATLNYIVELRQALSEQATFYQKQLDTLTETVKEHKRVLDECERALEGLRLAYVDLCTTRGVDYHKWAASWNGAALEALAAIAELKTNEKLG